MILLWMAGGFGAGLILSAGLNWMALIPWRKTAGQHWTERARKLYPARVAAVLNPWVIAFNVALGLELMGQPRSTDLAAAGAAWFGAGLGGYFVDREIWPGLTFKSWFGQ